MTTIQIYIVDDHPVVRRGLQSLLSNYDDIEVVGDADNIEKAQAGINQQSPDVVLLDIRLQGESGLDLLDWIKINHPSVKVIVLTSFDEDEYIQRALRNGARGFILKSNSDELLYDAVRTVFHNGRVLSSQVAEQIIQGFAEPSLQHIDESQVIFTDEERAILRLLVDGANNDVIASELFMSVASIKRRLQRIFAKLGVNNRALAIAETVRRKLLS